MKNKIFAMLGMPIAIAAFAASAQPSLEQKPSLTLKPGDLRIDAPIKRVLPDLTIVAAGETQKNIFYAKVKNIGIANASASNIYCAANVQKPDGSLYAIERQSPLGTIATGQQTNFGCDFNSGADNVKSGEKIYSVRFIANNHKQIVETNHNNNDMRTAPGTPFPY
ncbi:MAG: CARDB domain-containing protein [Casimicrobium sp.]